MSRTYSREFVWMGVSAALSAACLLACDDPAQRQARAEAKARAAELAAAEREAEMQQAELAKKAEREKRALAEQEAATRLEQARGALGACCTALARRGFEQRSMPDMTAKQMCLEAETKGDALAAVRPALLSALGDRGLPQSCLGD